MSVGNTCAKRRPVGASKFKSEPCQLAGAPGTSSAFRTAKPTLAAGAGRGSGRGRVCSGGSPLGSDKATPNGVYGLLELQLSQPESSQEPASSAPNFSA